MMERRAFIVGLPAVLVAARCGSDPAAAAPLFESPGVQLYTVRQAMAADPDGTLARLAGIGYREVELAGTYGLSAVDFRRKLDVAGLRAVSGHVGLDAVRNDWERTLDDANELGQSLIVVPSLPESVRSAEGLAGVAEEFDRAGEAARTRGLRFGYHNHQWEFEPLGGSTAMEILLDHTSAEVVDWQMDVFWTVDGGADPLVWMDRYQDRVTSIHIKDRTASGEMVDVGDGVIDFGAVFALGRRHALSHGFVEHDSPGDAMQSVRRSFEYLQRGVSS